MKIIRAAPGCVFCNGETYSETICLPDDADTEEWREIAVEQVDAAMESYRQSVMAISEEPDDPDMTSGHITVGVPST